MFQDVPAFRYPLHFPPMTILCISGIGSVYTVYSPFSTIIHRHKPTHTAKYPTSSDSSWTSWCMIRANIKSAPSELQHPEGAIYPLYEVEKGSKIIYFMQGRQTIAFRQWTPPQGTICSCKLLGGSCCRSSILIVYEVRTGCGDILILRTGVYIIGCL